MNRRQIRQLCTRISDLHEEHFQSKSAPGHMPERTHIARDILDIAVCQLIM